MDKKAYIEKMKQDILLLKFRQVSMYLIAAMSDVFVHKFEGVEWSLYNKYHKKYNTYDNTISEPFTALELEYIHDFDVNNIFTKARARWPKKGVLNDI